MERIAFLLLFSLILMEGRGQAVSETAAYYDSLAESELGKGNIESYLPIKKKAYILYKEEGNRDREAECCIYLGNYFNAVSQYDSAVYYLTRMPSPKIIFQAFAEVRPNIVIAVPLIIEKIIKKSVLPKLETPTMKLLLKVPFVNDKIKATVREQVIQAFGGNFAAVIVGGAAFNREVEQFLKMIDFPYTVGYGMTECGPIICYEDWRKFKFGSCGKAAPRMEVRILSADPENIPGEIICRGPNVMLGYYKNPEVTQDVLEPSGWLHTGDLALMDRDGNVTIKGRSKNMLLGPSGQNIYPEEIEDRLNNMPYVAESIVVQQNDKLVGLVYPDFDDAFAHGLANEDLERVMEENRVALNAELPGYCQLSKMKIYPEEFEKTPKKSIKRFLYQEAKG